MELREAPEAVHTPPEQKVASSNLTGTAKRIKTFRRYENRHFPTPEIGVLQQLAGGNRNRDIAERLFISKEAVKVHIEHNIGKLGVRDRIQTIAVAASRGIVQL
jgi:DNA-binding NarL/FixJ family response regulator